MPQHPENPLYQLLREDKVEEFNRRREAGERVDLRGADLRGLDLRGLETRGLELTDAYLRQTDLRGLDLTQVPMEGASIRGANVSGTYFPVELSAAEIQLSLMQGTRLRHSR